VARGIEIEPGTRSFAWRAAPETLVAARVGLVREHLSDRWPAVAAAGLPTLPIPATEPAARSVLNERLLPALRGRSPGGARLRPRCRHQVLADLGVRAGELVADWLRAKGLG